MLKMNIDYQLIKAVELKNVSEVKRLIHQGANINYNPPFINSTPLIEAVRNNDIDMIELLIQYGADVNDSLGFPVTWALLVAVTKEDIKLTEYLIQNGARTDLVDPILGRDVFLEAVIKDRMDILQILLKTHPDPIMIECALKNSLENDNLEAVRLLRQYQRIKDPGTSIDMYDRYGRKINITGHTGRNSHINIDIY